MHEDIVQHLIEVSHPWLWLRYMLVCRKWNALVRRASKPIAHEDAIKNCNLLAIDPGRRQFALPHILAHMCSVGDPMYRETIRYMINRGIHDWNPALAAACAAGQSDIVSYFLKRFSRYDWLRYNWVKNEHFKIDMHWALGNAVYGGDLMTITYCLKWLYKMRKRADYINHPANLQIQWRNIWYRACEGGSLPAIKLIKPYIRSRDRVDGLRGAYRGGQLNIIKLLEAEGEIPDAICLLNAIKSGNPEVIDYASRIREVYSIDRSLVPPECLKQVMKMPYIRLIDTPDNIEFYRACRAGDLLTVMNYEKILKQDVSPSDIYTIQYGLLYACESGQREIMNHFMQQGISCLCSRSNRGHRRYIKFKRYNWL